MQSQWEYWHRNMQRNCHWMVIDFHELILNWSSPQISELIVLVLPYYRLEGKGIVWLSNLLEVIQLELCWKDQAPGLLTPRTHTLNCALLLISAVTHEFQFHSFISLSYKWISCFMCVIESEDSRIPLYSTILFPWKDFL